MSIAEFLDTLPSKGIPSCECIVFVDHKEVFHHCVNTDPTRLYWLYSATKPFTMVTLMQLMEKGLLRLDDPVSRYLSEFAHMTVREGETVRPAKTVMTVEHLMTMCGGFDYDLERPALKAAQARYGKALTTREAIRALASEPLLFDPGTHFNYSLCHDVAAAVAEEASGVRFSELMQKNVFAPLGICEMTFHPTPAQESRTAPLYEQKTPNVSTLLETPNQIYRLSDAYESGGAALLGGASDYILLCDALANDGVGRTGARILSHESIENLRRNRMLGSLAEDFAQIAHAHGYGYGLGVRTRLEPEATVGRTEEFGWDGAAGAYMFADPAHRIGVFYVQHVLGCTDAYMIYHRRLRDMVYAEYAK